MTKFCMLTILLVVKVVQFLYRLFAVYVYTTPGVFVFLILVSIIGLALDTIKCLRVVHMFILFV